MKNVLVLLLLALTPNFQLFAAIKPIDSVKLKQRKAVWDVRFFKLDKETRKAFKKKRFDTTSDYFKPDINNVKNPALVSDSVYAKAYREAAYRKTIGKRTVGHYVLVAGGIYAGALVVATIALFLGL